MYIHNNHVDHTHVVEAYVGHLFAGLNEYERRTLRSQQFIYVHFPMNARGDDGVCVCEYGHVRERVYICLINFHL